MLGSPTNGVSDDRLEVHDTITTAYESLEQGKVDAVIQDGPNAYYYIKTTDGTKLEVVGDEFNQAIKDLTDDGTIDKLVTEWLE